MFDVSRLQEASKLAKELVEKGVAKDFEDALRIIEAKNFIKSNDELETIKTASPNRAVENKEKSDAVIGKSEGVMKEDKKGGSENESLLKEINELKDRLDKLASFVERYVQQNDKNLMEVDERLKKLESFIKDNQQKREVQHKISNKISTTKNKEVKKQITGAGEGLNPEDFAVDKIFDNSNGRLERNKS